MKALGENYVYLSPHPAVAALSLGSICGNSGPQVKRRLITVFSETDTETDTETDSQTDPADRPGAEEERACRPHAEEDRAFARAFTMARVDLGLPDFTRRTGRPATQACSAPLDAVEQVYAALSELKWFPNTKLFAPSAECGHTDHISCREAVVRFGRDRDLPVVFYAEMPYAMQAPGRIGPQYTFVRGDRKAWRRAAKCYGSLSDLIDEMVVVAGNKGAPLHGAYVTNQVPVTPPGRAVTQALSVRTAAPVKISAPPTATLIRMMPRQAAPTA